MMNITRASAHLSVALDASTLKNRRDIQAEIEDDCMQFFDLEAASECAILPVSVGRPEYHNNLVSQVRSDVDDDSVYNDAIDFDRDVRAAQRRYYAGLGLCINVLLPIWQDLCDPTIDTADVRECEAQCMGNESPDFNIVGKWDVNKETAEVLHSITAQLSEDPLSAWIGGSIKSVKVDESILSSDHQIDIIKIRRRNTISLSSQTVEPFALSDEDEESLRWSKKSFNIFAEIENQVADKKLAIDKEAAEFLWAIAELTGEESKELFSDVGVLKVSSLKLSPKLLPLSSSYNLTGLSSSTTHIDFTSTPEDPSIREATELDAVIRERDSLDTRRNGCLRSTHIGDAAGRKNSLEEHAEDKAQHNASEIPSADRNIDEHDCASYLRELGGSSSASSSSPSQQKGKRLHDLRMESPQLPTSKHESPHKRLKLVTFLEDLHNAIPMPASPASLTNLQTDAERARASIIEQMKPLVGSTLDQLATEVLSELDTTLRLPVTTEIADLEVLQPWRTYCTASGNFYDLCTQRQLLADVKFRFNAKESRWEGASEIEHLLPWTSFSSSLGNIKIDTDFDDGSLQQYTAELDLDDEMSPTAMACKAGGLRILDFDDGDCELEQMECVVDPEEITLIAKASKALNDDREVEVTQPNDSGKPALPREQQHVEQGWTGMDTLLQRRKHELGRDKVRVKLKAQHSTSLEQRPLAPRDFLSNFLQVRGRCVHTPCMLGSQLHMRQDGTFNKHITFNGNGTDTVCIGTEGGVPVPRLDRPERALSLVVISTSLLTHRQLIRKVTDLLPAVRLIERESYAVILQPGKASDEESRSCEASLTISPSTGLIFTSLQKLKQKPLPGQISFRGIREQMARVAIRYERLIVLVSGGKLQSRQLQFQQLDKGDASAMTDLIEHAGALDTDVQVNYVAGGEDELARWIASAVCRYAEPETHWSLLEDETVWEQFLRVAGMNASAAQAVLARVLVVDGGSTRGALTSTTSLDFRRGGGAGGLAAFVTMGAEERARRFGPLLGGDRVLRRVGRVIDGDCWMLTKGAV